ncbi:hypothetical protein QBC43DRAFT_247186 [Cladorrhinum sp. PSN259]|nr:hypothetical protein QBC43DRAFT_247186 [Cladorrhinum sp. PSN259]
MECIHCREKFQQQAEFAAHRDKHAKIQVQLKRTGTRTYGARYTQDDASKDKKTEQPKTEQPKTEAIQAATNKPASTTSTAPGSSSKTLTQRVRGIIDRFEPYEDGVEEKPRRLAELQCPDCDFKLRNQEELDQHILSVYCRGANIVQYLFHIDSSKPRGYYVEEKLVAFDEHTHPSKFQCRKCEEMFQSVKAMQEHEDSHPILPQVCLHCNKVFGTEYELETHYEWHDDMEYRQMVDKQPTTDPQNTHTLSRELEGIVSAEEINIGKGILKIPYPNYVGKKAPGPHKDKTLGGISWISREDVEKCFAPGGRVVRPETHYYSIPAHITQEEAQRIISQHNNNQTFVAVGDGGRMVTAGRDEARQEAPLAASSDSSLKLLAHHILGAGIQVHDVVGRLRYLNAAAYASILLCFIGGAKNADELGKALDDAVMYEQSGDINRALMSWKKVLDLLTGPDKTSVKPEKPFLAMTRVAMLSTQLNRTDEAIGYWCDAIELSEKLFGIHNINNYNFINSIAVILDKRGDFAQAAPLYRRSLAGRLRVNGPEHADTLMSMQELAMANWRLGRPVAARKLLERACLGYENLRPRNDNMNFAVLQNLASVYGTLFRKKDASALLLNGIPRFRSAVGVDETTLSYAINNYLKYHEGAVLPAVIMETIRSLRQSRSVHSLEVTENLASFYHNNRQYCNALPLYRDAILRRRQRRLLPTDPGLVNNLHAVARCHELLGEFVKAETAYRELASATTPGTSLHSFATQSIGIIRRRLDRISAERNAWGLPPYSSPVILDDFRACAVCKKQTNRQCADCQISSLCHVFDSPSCTEKHKSAGSASDDPCVPSFLPSESVTATIHSNMGPMLELQARFRTLFWQDHYLCTLMTMPSLGKGGTPPTAPQQQQQPKMVSLRPLFLTKKPRCIATVRLPRTRKERILSVWFNNACNVDARIRWVGSGAPVVNDPDLRWKDLSSRELGMMYLYPRVKTDDDDNGGGNGSGVAGANDHHDNDDEDAKEEECWLLVAPGKESLNKAVKERTAVFSDGKGLTAEGVPDKEMLEWLQMVDDKELGQNNGAGPELELALVMMEWEL